MKNKFTLSIVAFCFCILFVPCFVRAATINAASCNLSDVQAALNSAVDGDIISVPMGNCIWASTLIIPSTLSVSIIGAGVNNTYIAISGAKTFNIRPNQGEFVRISNMELLCGVDISAGSGGVTTKVQDGFRVDHIKINQTTRGSTECGRGGRLGNQEAWTYGVFDHIEFYYPGATGVLSGTPQRTAFPFGLGPWLEDAGWGGKDFIYLEDSIIHNTYGGNLYTVGSFDGRYGWKIVLRYNDMLDVNWGGHDMHTTNSHSLRAMEIYNNTWRLTSNNGEALSWNGGAGTRGGGYTVFGNRLATSRVQDLGNGQPLLLNYYRSSNPLGAWGTCDSVQEKFCVGTNNPAPHPFSGLDQNAGVACTSDSQCGVGNYCVPVDSQTEANGYLCREQTGAGKIDPITGAHSLDPAYEWDNLWCRDGAGGLCTPNADLDWRINNISQIVIGRDVFNDTQRPGYAPYTYPHPLTVISGSQPSADTTAPSIPTNLIATAVSASQINLSWTISTDSMGVTGYRIYRGGAQITTSAINSYSDTGLSASTTYIYAVAAYDAAGNASNQSGSASATTSSPVDITPPVRSNGSPTGQLTANTTQANLSLVTNENATCKYSDNAGTAYALMANTFSTTGNLSHSTVVSGLQNGQSYAFYMKCEDSSDNANSDDYTINFSVVSAAPVTDVSAPSAPTNLAVIVISSSQINLSWTVSTDNTGVTGYRIYRGGEQIAVSATNSYSNTGLNSATTYSYSVVAYDAAGNVSSQSSQVSATTQTASTTISNTTQSGSSGGAGGGGTNSASSQTNTQAGSTVQAGAVNQASATTQAGSAENFSAASTNPLYRGSGDTKVYEVIGNLRHWIPNPQTFNAYGFNWNAINVVDSGEIIKYARVKLLRAQGDTKVYYLTESGQIRHIPNPEIFNSYNNNWNEILAVSQTEIDSYPVSNLIRLEGGAKVYKLENSKKRWITTAEAFNRLKYDWTKIAPVNQTELNYYPEGVTIN